MKKHSEQGNCLSFLIYSTICNTLFASFKIMDKHKLSTPIARICVASTLSKSFPQLATRKEILGNC